MIYGLVAVVCTAIAVFVHFYLKKMASSDNSELVVPIEAPASPKIDDTAAFTHKPTQSMIETFCIAIKRFEGANPANNNPGNCRCSEVGYLPKYGKVLCNANDFAVFPTYELGWEYLQNLVHQRAVAHPNWTFYDFFENYAPSGDKNDPTTYAKFVAERCGVSADTTLSSYLS